MVPHTLVRRFSRLLLIAISAAIVVFAAWIFMPLGDVKQCPDRWHGDNADSGGCGIAKRTNPPADDEIRAYLQIIQGAVNAYSNSQVEAMFKELRQLPSKAYQLRGEDRLKLERPINRIWRDAWVLNKGVKVCASEEEFDHQMKKSLAIAKLYGEFMVTSGAVANEILVTIDWVALKRLQTYRDEFERDGKTDCLQSAERLLANWIEQIESEKGFTRTYVRAQKVGLRHFVKTGELSEEKFVQYLSDYVRPLQDRCGYTPKWLEKELPHSDAGCFRGGRDLR